MNRPAELTVFSPVSIGNVSVGFDSLGLALRPIDGQLLGDQVSIRATEKTSSFELKGSFADRLPQDKESNIVWSALQLFDQALQTQGQGQSTRQQAEAVHLTLHKNIPVCSGLGSSACSVVAALMALNEWHQQPFDDDQLLQLMGQAEGQISGSVHYDNVAPCFLGGMQLMGSQTITTTLPDLPGVYWLIAYPDVEVSTQAARALLPPQYDRSTLIRFGQNLAGFVAACYQQDTDLALSLIDDEVAEPYRAELLPNYAATKQQLLKMGSAAVGISGSGPTLFSACTDLKTAEQQAAWLQQNYLQSDRGIVAICQSDSAGSRTLNPSP